MIQEAARWTAQLATDDATPDDRAACEAWCREHPMHRLVLERMRGLDARIREAGDIDRRTTETAPRRRSRIGRRLGGAAVGLLLLAGGGWIASHSLTVRGWSPDFETSAGEHRAIILADGSGLTLQAGSALDFVSEGDRRYVTLFKGKIAARVAPDRSRPFIVETRDGTITALGTTFIVQRDDHSTIVAVIESRVRTCTAGAARRCLDLVPGDQVRMGAGPIERLERFDPETTGMWARGWLAADDRPVTEVLVQLNRYRSHPARFDEDDLAGVRVSGSFPLTDPDRALDGLARSTGLVLSRSDDGALWVRRAK